MAGQEEVDERGHVPASVEAIRERLRRDGFACTIRFAVVAAFGMLLQVETVDPGLCLGHDG
jgi:hypothetical protein